MYETSDAVFGVKSSLLIDLSEVDKALAEKYGVKVGTKLMKYDFILVSEQETIDMRAKNSKDALDLLGYSVRIVHGLPIPDID